MSETIRFILAALLFFSGLLSIIVSFTGVYKYRFVLDRMQSAAILDTLGLSFLLFGLAVASGSFAYLPKLLLVLLIQWVGSPIASHMVGRLEVDTDPTLRENVTEQSEDKLSSSETGK